MKIRHILISMLLVCVSAASLTSCLDVVNSDRISSSNMWKEESDVTGATAGIYYRLRSTFVNANSNQFYWGEFRVGPAMWDNGTKRSQVSHSDVLHSNMNSTTGSANWTELYTTIDQCNAVIKYAPTVEMSDAGYAYCMGNACFVRAFCYYWIARVWGDAPIVLDPTESTGKEIYPSRSPKASVYAQVENDIEEALKYITDNGGGCYYATRDNVNMLKADYALWMYSAQKAGDSYLTMAQNALSQISDAALLDSYSDVFNVNNKKNREIMFAIHCDAVSEVGSSSYINYFIWGPTLVKEEYRNVADGVPVSVTQWYLFADSYIDELKANRDQNNDQRTDVVYQERTGVSDNYDMLSWCNKFTGDWSSGTLIHNDDLIMYRGAQYYMFLAELNYYKGDYSKALEYLNVVAQRAYGVSGFYTSATKEDVLEALAKENRWEFAEEGNLWFTYIRLGYIDSYCPYKYWENTGVTGGVGGSGNPNIYLFPVSSSAIDKNSNIKQTEGWS